MSEFIFMLTRNDTTLADAREVYASIADTGVRHVGCKDVGLPREELRELMADIRGHGHVSYLEVVAETEQDTLQSARVAADVRPDYLIGGTLIEPVQQIIEGTRHPLLPVRRRDRRATRACCAAPSIAIAEDARRAEAAGVDGINLLAYRYDGDVPALVRARLRGDVAAASSPRARSTPWPASASSTTSACGRFTIGTAALDGKLEGDADLQSQLRTALGAAVA